MRESVYSPTKPDEGHGQAQQERGQGHVPHAIAARRRDPCHADQVERDGCEEDQDRQDDRDEIDYWVCHDWYASGCLC
jgi:hypothetical protein